MEMMDYGSQLKQSIFKASSGIFNLDMVTTLVFSGLNIKAKSVEWHHGGFQEALSNDNVGFNVENFVVRYLKREVWRVFDIGLYEYVKKNYGTMDPWILHLIYSSLIFWVRITIILLMGCRRFCKTTRIYLILVAMWEQMFVKMIS